MRYNLQLIANDLGEIANEKKQRQLEREAARNFDELKQLARMLIISTLQTNLDNGLTLAYLYTNRDEIIKTIAADIQRQTTEAPDPNTFDVTKTIEVAKYNYPPFMIASIVSNLFFEIYNDFKRMQNEETRIQKTACQKTLAAYFRNTFDYAESVGAELADVYYNLKEATYKEETIKATASNDAEADYIRSIYAKTLNAIKREYNTAKNQPTGTDGRLALSWQLVAGYKAIGKIWKS